jgi:hypothetical protein
MTENIYKVLLPPAELRKKSGLTDRVKQLNINNHIHTPYSFSSFSDMDEIFSLAEKEQINVLGINDFYVADGYEVFKEKAFHSGIFPVFNMEYIGLLNDEQSAGIRVNDPNNPGRTYLTGKAFKVPFKLDNNYEKMLDGVVKESQEQVREMVDKTNARFKSVELSITLSFNDIKERFAEELVRERHLARAIRIAVFETFPDNNSRMDALKKILNTEVNEQLLSSEALLENLIRSKLLKKGGIAFVEETESSFLPVADLVKLIINAGGIPTYPVLLDDPAGNFTKFEEDWEKLYKRLISLGIYSLELIPGRNDKKILTDFVRFFDDKGFVISFGTEHNTPDMQALTVKCRNGEELGDTLQEVQYRGICVLAAHQYLMAFGEKGYVGEDVMNRISEKREFEEFGNLVLQEFFSVFK